MANLIGAAYKWRIDNNVYSYITNTEGGEPFIVSGSTECNEELIRNKVQNFTKEQYETKFQEMVSAVHAYNNGKYSYVQFLDYTIYMNECEHCDIYNRPDVVTDIDFTVYSTTLPSDSEATVGVHTIDEDIECREGEKIRKYHIDFGIPKGSRFIPIKVTDEELLQNGEQIIRENDILAGDFIVSVDSNTIWYCGRDYQFINSGVQLSGRPYRYFPYINAYSFGEGDIAEGENSITEGGRTKTEGEYAHAEGVDTRAEGRASHSEGEGTHTEAQASHAEGSNTRTHGFAAHAEGLGFDETNGGEKTAIIKELNDADKLKIRETYGIEADWVQPTNVLVDGKLYDIYTADGETKLCSMTTSLFDQHHLVFGKYGGGSGWNRTGALFSVDNNSVLNDGATYVFKRRYGAFGSASHTEGVNAFAVGDNSHAEGDNSMAIGKNSHAEGSLGGAYGENSHVEGNANTANGLHSHAEGRANTASGKASHAEGDTTLAIGDYSHAEGYGNVAKNKGQHVSGTYAEIDETGNAIFQVGIGDDGDTRKDAFRINKDGSFVFAVPENANAPIFTFHPSIAQQEASAINEDEGEEGSVQTYNMRRSAARQTSVSVTTSNFIDLINLQSTLDGINSNIDEIIPEIEKDLGELRSDFEEIIDEQESNYNESIAEILSKTSDLESQLDGEATAWFLKGEPTLSNEPAKDWNENGTDGKESYESHEGDTYTDITEKEDGSIGKSWRWSRVVNASGETIGWDWHEISDSRIIRALYEASRAQSTADGKSTVYISKDEDGNRVPDHYQAGDMWIINDIALQNGGFDHDEKKNIYYTKEINEDGEVQRGTPISVGEMLTANANSKEYNVTHWSKEIKYTDDSYIIEAELATQAAYAAAEERHKEALRALEQLNEIGRDGRVYETEFEFLNGQIGVISGDTNELVGADGTQGEASLWEGMTDSADEYFVAANSAITALRYYTDSGNYERDAKTQTLLDYIQIKYEDDYNWKHITHYYIARQELLNDIADASKNYSSGIQGISNLAALNASAAQNAADEAAEGANAALGMLDEVDNDKVVSTLEFDALESELEIIERDLIEIEQSIKLYNGSKFYEYLNGSTINYTTTGTTITNTSTTVTYTGTTVSNPVTYSGFTEYEKAQINAVNALKYHCGKTATSNGVNVTAGEREGDKNQYGSIIIKSSKEGMNNTTTILGVDVNYENIVNYYTVRQSMLEHIAFVAKLYAESLQAELSPENVQTILEEMKIYGVNLVTGSRYDFYMGQWGSTHNLSMDKVEGEYTQTQINEDSKLSFCTCLYNPDSDPDKNVDVITNKQWEDKYISASIDIFIPKDNVTEEDKQNPKKVNFGIVLRCYDNGNPINLFSAYTNNIECVYNDWTRLQLTFPMEKDITDVFTKDGKDYLVSNVYLVVYDSVSTYTSGTIFKFRKIQIEFNTACSSWYPSPYDIDETYSIAVDAQKNADAAMKEANESMILLSDMSSDDKLTPPEKVNIRKEWGEIQEEYEQATIDVENAWPHGFQKPQEYTDYSNIYNVLKGYLGTGYTGNEYTIKGYCDINSTETTDISGHTITINEEDYSGKTCFNKVFSTYYAKHVAFMNCLAEQLAYLEVRSIEIGGRNLLRNSKEFILSATETNNYAYKQFTPTVGLKPNTNYIFSVDKSEITPNESSTGFTIYLFDNIIKNGRNKLTIPISSTRQTISFKTTSAVTDTDVLLIYAGIQGYTSNKTIKLTNFKLEEGDVATAWSMAPEDQMEYIDSVNNYVQEMEELLQNQIDGVVNSYFMEGAPCDTDGTVKTTVEPFSEWKGSYEVSNNIYTLKSGEINHLMNHLGDTYTNISSSEDDTTGGQSWRWCDITSITNHESTSKYITVKYTSDYGSTISKNLHWHKIADSDAVKALQAAAAAQDTADSKRRVFTNKPYTPYDVGDLWVKTDVNNSSLNDTLYCQSARTSGDWSETDWVSSTAALAAMDTANSALTAVENVDYLTDIIENGETVIDGGLILTNVLALRNLDTETNNKIVTGGMSGVINDNVLLWGGGTYSDAKSAAVGTDYLKEDGVNKITTLIKKDGTGKIGAFYIDDDTVKVVTDTNTIIITNQDNTKYSFDTINLSSNACSYISEYSGEHFVNSSSNCFSGTTDKTIIISNTVTFSRSGKFKLIVDGFNIKLQVSGSTNNVTTPTVGNYLETSVNSIRYILKPKDDLTNSDLVNKKYDLSTNNSVIMSYGSSGWEDDITKTCEVSRREFDFDYSGTNLTNFVMSVVVNVTSSLNTGISQERLQWSGEITIPSIKVQIASTEKYTIFSKSGISIIDGSNNYFHINNTDGMEIKIKGLPKRTTPNDLSSGQLYINTSNQLMIKP